MRSSSRLFLLFILVVNISSTLFADDIKGLLFNGNCTTCHFINRSVSAPSIKEIQKVYKNGFSTKKEFVKYMSNWVLKPNKEGSLMDYAIKKYGLMPELAFDEESVIEITEYIYDLDIK